MLIAKDKYQAMSRISIGELILTLVLMPILMTTFGNVGAAYALLCSHLIIWGGYVPWLMTRKLQMPISSYYLCLITPTLLVWLIFQAFDLFATWLLTTMNTPYIVNFVALEVTLIAAVLIIAYRTITQSHLEVSHIHS